MEKTIIQKFHNAYIEENSAVLDNLWNNYAPKTLIKFFPAIYESNGNNYFLEHLKSHSLWLSSPKKFNDPFDCLTNYDYTSQMNQIINTYLLPLTSKMTLKPNMNYADFQNQLAEVVSDYSKSMSKINKKTENRIFVSCFSEKENLHSSRMWGHYSNNHTGVCAEYDWDTLNAASPFGCLPINYTDQYEYFPVPSNTQESTKNFLRFYTKSTEWSYEKEWRVAHTNDIIENGFSIPFPLPRKIYFGCHTPSKLKKDIKNICTLEKIELYQMHIQPNSFCLSCVKID